MSNVFAIKYEKRKKKVAYKKYGRFENGKKTKNVIFECKMDGYLDTRILAK